MLIKKNQTGEILFPLKEFFQNWHDSEIFLLGANDPRLTAANRVAAPIRRLRIMFPATSPLLLCVVRKQQENVPQEGKKNTEKNNKQNKTKLQCFSAQLELTV